MINLAVFGFQVDPSDHRPVQRRSTRGSAVSQPLIDLARAQRLHGRRAQREGRDARRQVGARSRRARRREPVSRGGHRGEPDRASPSAQLDTAQALFRQASDLRPRGWSPNVDVLRAQVQVQNQRQRSIVAENEFEKAKLQLARAIGLPPGQAFTLTDKIPFAPLDNLSVEDALARAYDQRADFLAAQRSAWPPPRPRAAPPTRSCLPSLRLDADYGTIGQTVSEAHPTYTVGADRARADLRGRARRRRAAPRATRCCSGAAPSSRTSRGRSTSRSARALLDVRAAAQQLDAAQTTVTLASQELEQARDRFAAGVASNIEVTQAQEIGRRRVGDLHRRALRAQPGEGLARARARASPKPQSCSTSEECSNG